MREAGTALRCRFLLTDSSGNFIGTNNGRYVTNSAGEILVEGLTPGTTVVAREVRAKPGYLLDDSPQYALIRSGETVGLEFRNAPAGNLVIVKRSSSGTHEPLEGVEFKITYADGPMSRMKTASSPPTASTIRTGREKSPFQG